MLRMYISPLRTPTMELTYQKYFTCKINKTNADNLHNTQNLVKIMENNVSYARKKKEKFCTYLRIFISIEIYAHANVQFIIDFST